MRIGKQFKFRMTAIREIIRLSRPLRTNFRAFTPFSRRKMSTNLRKSFKVSKYKNKPSARRSLSPFSCRSESKSCTGRPQRLFTSRLGEIAMSCQTVKKPTKVRRLRDLALKNNSIKTRSIRTNNSSISTKTKRRKSVTSILISNSCRAW